MGSLRGGGAARAGIEPECVRTGSACLQPGQQPCPLEDRLFTLPLLKAVHFAPLEGCTPCEQRLSPVPACRSSLPWPTPSPTAPTTSVTRLGRTQQYTLCECGAMASSPSGSGLPAVSGGNSLMGGEAGCGLVRLACPAARAAACCGTAPVIRACLHNLAARCPHNLHLAAQLYPHGEEPRCLANPSLLAALSIPALPRMTPPAAAGCTAPSIWRRARCPSGSWPLEGWAWCWAC